MLPTLTSWVEAFGRLDPRMFAKMVAKDVVQMLDLSAVERVSHHYKEAVQQTVSVER